MTTLTPFEQWMTAKGHDLATISNDKRMQLGEEYLQELKSKRADHTKIVKK